MDKYLTIKDDRKRERSNSLQTVKELISKKREAEIDSFEIDLNIFKKSKLTPRSPPEAITKQKTKEDKEENPTEESMDRILEKLEELAKDISYVKNNLLENIKGDIHEIKKTSEEGRKELMSVKEEFQKYKEEMDGKLKEIEKENMQLKEKMKHLEERDDERERKDRRRNLIIKTEEISPIGRNNEKGREFVEELCEKKLK